MLVLYKELIAMITTATQELHNLILQQEEREAMEKSIENSFEELDNFMSIITETKESANRALSSLSESLSEKLPQQRSLTQPARSIIQGVSEKYDKSMQSQQKAVKHFSEGLSEQTNQFSTVKNKNNAKRKKIQ